MYGTSNQQPWAYLSLNPWIKYNSAVRLSQSDNNDFRNSLTWTHRSRYHIPSQVRVGVQFTALRAMIMNAELCDVTVEQMSWSCHVVTLTVIWTCWHNTPSKLCNWVAQANEIFFSKVAISLLMEQAAVNQICGVKERFEQTIELLMLRRMERKFIKTTRMRHF